MWEVIVARAQNKHGDVLRILEKIKIPMLRGDIHDIIWFVSTRLSVIATKYAEMMTASNPQKYFQNIFLFSRHLDNGEHEKHSRKEGIINEIN